MKGLVRFLIFWVSAAIAAGVLILTIVFRFEHPDMTETQLFLKQAPAYALVVVAIYIAFFSLLGRRSK
jgi:uncharacterized membrane protein